MKKSQLKKIIRETLKEIDLREKVTGYVDGDRNKPICSCNGVNWINCGAGCACCNVPNPAMSGAIPMEANAENDGADLATARLGGGLCRCIHYVTGPGGESTCKTWSPAGCGDAPFSVTNNKTKKK